MPDLDWCRYCGAAGPHAGFVTYDTAEDEDDLGYPICDECVASHEGSNHA